jgi:hypothetical protein
MFVGYNVDSKACRLIDFTTRKLKVSRDVVFNEANISCSKLDATLTPISR